MIHHHHIYPQVVKYARKNMVYDQENIYAILSGTFSLAPREVCSVTATYIQVRNGSLLFVVVHSVPWPSFRYVHVCKLVQ